MFSPSSPARTNIEEANKHLQLLHGRIQELENTVKEQTESLMKKDESMQLKLRDLVAQQDEEVQFLREKVEAGENQNHKLKAIIKEKDDNIIQLQQKCDILNDILKSTPALQQLVLTMSKAQMLVNGDVGSVPDSSNQSPLANMQSVNGRSSAQTFSQMAQGYRFSRPQRHFSISEDDVDEDETFPKILESDLILSNKELYL